MTERAAEIEDLCVIVHARDLRADARAPRRHPRHRAPAACSRRRTRSRAASRRVVIDGPLAEDGAVAALARAAGVPLIAGVAGVFAWVHPGDLLVVDADAGSVRVNPEATQVARFRNQRA